MKHLSTSLCLLALLCLSALTAWSDIPPYIGYQGVLRDSGGEVVADGSYDVTFSIYEAVTGGTAIWSELQSVDVEGGIMNVSIGVNEDLTAIPFDVPYWLGLAIEGEAELVPRTELLTAPYAGHAGYADHAAQADTADFAWSVGSGSGWTVSGDDMYSTVLGGVGIGDTDPEWMFDIHNDEAANTYMQITNGATGGGGIWTGLVIGVSGTGDAWISQGSAAGIHIGGGASLNSVNIDSDGKVTVGLEAFPDSEMAVYGDFETFGFQMPTGAQASYVLTSDGTGVGTWQPNAGPVATASANGNVVLDASGEAQVELPAHLSGAELRYQLTCIGGFAPVFVAEKASGGVFTIAGGEPGMEISWQVTGE